MNNTDKTEILRQITDVRNTIKTLENKAIELEQKVETFEEKKSKVWKPEKGDQVWITCGGGRIEQVTYDDSYDSFDHEYYEMRMLFQTKEHPHLGQERTR